MLADMAPVIERSAASTWKIVGEFNTGLNDLSGVTSVGSGAQAFARESLSVRYQGNLSRDWSAVFASRVDAYQYSTRGGGAINSLQEAYLGWRVTDNHSLRFGRINLRNGVGIGYNPTDYFRTGAIRSQVSFVPFAQREGRLGAVMLDGQRLWDGGAFNFQYSPDLAQRPSSAHFSPDFGTTNNMTRWLASMTVRLSPDIQPQFLVFKQAGQSAQFGLNLTSLEGNSTVVYLDASVGRKPGLLDVALGQRMNEAWHAQFATGATYTTAFNLSVTLEYEHDTSSLNEVGWKRLVTSSPAVQQQFSNYVTSSQELPTRNAAFVYASWKDAGVRKLDFSALMRYELVTKSMQYWSEARYHWDRVDLAFQYLRNSGPTSSVYGSMGQRQSWQVILDCYY